MSFSEKCFSQGGKVALNLENFELRPQQIEMAKAVEEAIEAGENLLVEAGTGVGKTLAYLVPLIVWAKENRKRVVISTYTKALQNQLYVKNLPFLKNILDIDFNFALCLGSENYICLRKARKESVVDTSVSEKKEAQIDYIMNWIKETDTGLMTDMEIIPERAVWNSFSREAGLCVGRRCKFWEECFYRTARTRQSGSEILITNHALLFSDVVSGSKVLPEFNAIVMDEAHTIEDIATNYFGHTISGSALGVILDQIRTVVKNIKRDELDEGLEALAEIEGLINEITVKPNIFTRAGKIFSEKEGMVKFDTRDFIDDIGLMHRLVLLSGIISDTACHINDPEKSEEMKYFGGRCEKIAGSIDFIFNENNMEYAYWLYIKKLKKENDHSFHAAPIDVSKHMKKFFFERELPVILTSATLTTGKGDFSFIKKRLGLPDPLELVLDSPFDYKSKVLIYTPNGKSDPAHDAEGYKKHLKNNIIEIYETLGGRIFCLFTSYDMLNNISALIMKERAHIEILRQGDMPRYVLLDVFKKNPSAMLMGTTTFWQGIDVPGEALECVIITKFPFAVPTDPVNAARIEVIRADGSHPFTEYQLPQAVIMFKQGFGRLIRTKTDRGVVAILDPRIKTRPYGRIFLDALPECKQSDEIADVRSFFT